MYCDFWNETNMAHIRSQAIPQESPFYSCYFLKIGIEFWLKMLVNYQPNRAWVDTKLNAADWESDYFSP